LLDVASVLVIVAGCLSFFMAWDGIFSVCREWRCMFGLYIGGLIVVLILEVATVVTCVIFTMRVEDHLYNATYQGIVNQFEGHIVTDNSFSKAFDGAQVE
ncbi:tetraspanin, partial [Elysia marginata]